MERTQELVARRRLARDPRRLLLAGVGVVAVALGGIGVVVPGLPTTVFLLVASYCFTKSCPWLEERLLRTPFFAPYMRYVDSGQPMPRRARVTVMVALWASVAASLYWLHLTGRLGPWLASLIVGAALIGSAAIALHGRVGAEEAAAARTGAAR